MTERFSEQYKKFLDNGKTEFKVVEQIWDLALANGFIPYHQPYTSKAQTFSPGDRFIQNIKGKGLVMAIIVRRSVNEGLKIAAAHTDSPRLDLKPVPFQEDNGLVYLKTHYYGGIKKYQWTCIPLALHGRVSGSGGNIRNIVIGEAENDAKFVITDLLPHLSDSQLSKSEDIIITGEQLRLLCSISNKEGTGVEQTDSIINENFGITSSDIRISEFEAVPAFKASDAGIDRSMIASYGQDDRACVFSAVNALMDIEEGPEYTCMAMLSDQEEVGSENSAGLYSNAFLELLYNLTGYQDTNLYRAFSNAECLSADAICGYAPFIPKQPISTIQLILAEALPL